MAEENEDYSKSWNLDSIRTAFARSEKARRSTGLDYAYRYVKEVWTDFILVCDESYSVSESSNLVKVPYTVSSDGTVSFGSEIPVKVEYVEASGQLLWSSPHGPAVMRLSGRLGR